MSGANTAAFFRVEGSLISAGSLAWTTYTAANAQTFRERVLRLGQVAASAPVIGWFRNSNRTLSNRIMYLAFRGMSEDRLAVLGREYYDEVIRNRFRPSGLSALRKAQNAGHRIVLLSEALSFLMEPILEDLQGIDDLVLNHLEMRQGQATGRLLDPVVGGSTSIRWLKDYARNHSIDLARSEAYASYASDALLLSAVGRPCAIQPDARLRRTAKEARWPVIETHI